MSTPEGRFYQAAKKRLNELAKIHPLWWMKIHGSAYQRAGVPDILVVAHGLALFVELKAPGKKATKLQEHVMDGILYAGGRAVVAYEVKDVENAVMHLLEGD